MKKMHRLLGTGVAMATGAVVLGSGVWALAGTDSSSAAKGQAVTVSAAQPASVPIDQTEAALAPVRTDIVGAARYEYGIPAHRGEKPSGSNCNYYSSRLGSGSACSSGWRSVSWCADFARYIWRQAKVDHTDVLNAYADSFRTYGKKYGQWHPAGSGYTAMPGDAVVYQDENGNGLADHVGIVISNSGGKMVTIEGNWNNQVTQRTNPTHIWGFTRPIRA